MGHGRPGSPTYTHPNLIPPIPLYVGDRLIALDDTGGGGERGNELTAGQSHDDDRPAGAVKGGCVEGGRGTSPGRPHSTPS